jgi:tetratricopeptide (TPR) repeat protein
VTPARALIAVLCLGTLACSRPRPAGARAGDDLVALNNRGVGLMGRFEYGAARDAFASLAVAHPDQLDVQVNLAIATLNRQAAGDDGEARRILERVLAVDPGNRRAHYCLGLLLLHDGRPADARPHFEFVVGHGEPDAYALYHDAQCRLQQGDLAGALAGYDAALAADPRLRSAAYGAFQTLQRLGRADEARRMLSVFRTLETNPQSEVVEFKYTRMGPLGEATVIDRPATPAQPRPAGPVFEPTPTPVVATAGIAWRRFAAGPPPSITAADIDGDGLVDLFIAGAYVDRGRARNAVLLNRGASGFVLDPTHPLAAVTDVTAALWGDYDNDGLTDVYLCRRGSNQLWRQTARGRWADVTAAAHAGGGGGDTVDGAMVDADHDGDLDLLLAKSGGADELLNNDGNGSFRPLGRAVGLAADRGGSTGVLVADLDADRDADIVVIRRRPPNEVLINDRTWRYHREPGFHALEDAPITAAVAGDLDADGRPELYASGAAGVSRWTRDASGVWTPRLIDGTGSLADAVQLALADVDGDGRLDLVGSDADGRWRAVRLSANGGARPLFDPEGPAIAGWTLAVLEATRGPSLVAIPRGGGAPLVWRPGSGRFAFATIALSGRAQSTSRIRSNSSGIGAAVAVRTDSKWTSLSTYRSQSGVGQSLQPLPVGMGGRGQLDFVSITWSDGVLQTELALGPGAHAIGETERQLSSCPLLFAFDGRHFAFVTDVLGVGGIGTHPAPGVYDPPRPRENVLLPPGLPAARDGRLAVKLAEPMEETAYIDAVRLVAYDLPPGWQLVLDERKATAPPEATGAPRFYRDERVPVQAIDDGGTDVTQAVSAADGIAAPAGRIDPRFIGLTADHVLTLRFDAPLDEGPGQPTLVADGWVEYPYAQTLFAAWQAGAQYRAPSIDGLGADGGWHELRREFGYPAGMPRRMSLPLGALPRGTRELRLRTTQEIYWDRLAVAWVAPCPLATGRTLPLEAARLVRSGFEQRETGPGRRPSYDYDRRTPFADVRYQRGRYTAEGPVDDLLAAEDGAVAIFGPGEELHLEFLAPQTPPRAGWTRRFVLEARGWCKDMDLYTSDGDTVEPLPGVRDPEAARLQRRYTTRYESGR